jgi:hypothetical protein
MLAGLEKREPTKLRAFVPDQLCRSKARGVRGKITFSNRRWLTVEFEDCGISKDYSTDDFKRLWRIVK